jgi:WD40 repeat protein
MEGSMTDTTSEGTTTCPDCGAGHPAGAASCPVCGHAYATTQAPEGPGHRADLGELLRSISPGGNRTPLLVILGAVGLGLALISSALLIGGGCQPAATGMPGAANLPRHSYSGAFNAVGSLATGRWGHAATLLPDGRVLVAGGFIGATSGAVASAELYDPKTGKFSVTGAMSVPRALHTATLLGDGRVLVVAGADDGDGLSSAELYDLKTGRFTATGATAGIRWGHTANLLPNGRVLIAGGRNGVNVLSSAELYDPKTGKFSSAGAMVNPLVWHTATTMLDGRVLLAGGQTDSYRGFERAAQLFDPKTGQFSATGSLDTGRAFHAATLLPDGRVIVVGGSDNLGHFTSAELYDPKTGTFSTTGSMRTARKYLTCTLLSDAKVLVVGGGAVENGSLTNSSTAELFDPAAGTWTSTASMAEARGRHTATMLSDGRILVVGGLAGESAAPSPSAELYS